MRHNMATAEQVKELRERTGAGFMDCKKALEAVNNDLEAAVKYMKEQGTIKAAKKAERTTAEGVIEVTISADQKKAIIIEINCETDFVTRSEKFREFVQKVAQIALNSEVKTVEELSQLTYENNLTVETKRQELIAQIGENIQIRRLSLIKTSGTLSFYKHGDRIAALVEIDSSNAELGKDLAMHIVASNPQAVQPSDVPQDLIASEQAIFLEQAKTSGKPEAIINKMVEGKMQKLLNEISLVGQPFVKDPDKTVGELLKSANTKVLRFVRYQVGEGIEKKTTNFAEEVMAQVQGR